MRKRPNIAGLVGKAAVVLVLIGGVAVIGEGMLRTEPSNPVNLNFSGSLDVIEPATLSPLAVAGKALFGANCAVCHGPKANGTDHGPPFVNDIYQPGHHPDEAFHYAAKNGVPSHHWRFGNMPPVEGVSDADVTAIVCYIRELQEANGIRYHPHVM